MISDWLISQYISSLVLIGKDCFEVPFFGRLLRENELIRSDVNVTRSRAIFGISRADVRITYTSAWVRTAHFEFDHNSLQMTSGNQTKQSSLHVALKGCIL